MEEDNNKSLRAKKKKKVRLCRLLLLGHSLFQLSKYTSFSDAIGHRQSLRISFPCFARAGRISIKPFCKSV